MKLAAHIFKALADPTRRQILQELKAGEMPAGEIAALFEMAGPSVSRHLSILKHAELIHERKEGNRIFYELQPDRLAHCLNDFLSQVCPTQMVQRKKLARKTATKKSSVTKKTTSKKSTKQTTTTKKTGRGTPTTGKGRTA